MKEKAREAWDITKQTFKEWKEDDGIQWGAALAYYTIFALAPMLLIALAVAGLFLDEEAVEGRVFDEIESVLGTETAEFVQGLVERSAEAEGGILTASLGIVLLLVGATGAFWQLSIALNRMWEIRAEPEKGWLRLIKKRVLSFGLVLVIGLLMLFTLLLSALISAIGSEVVALAPGLFVLVQILIEVVTVGAATVLFALIFRYLPDARIEWKDVWLGAFATAVLFEIGKLLFGLYLGRATVGSEFGAAASLVLILVWAWFVSQIIFVGAEFTQVYARRHGKRIEPEPHAVRTDY